MTAWGVVRNDDEHASHILPCDKQGAVLEPHEPSKSCACGWRVADTGEVIHHDPARGGFDQ